MTRHVHLHCLVPGGALGSDGHWHPARSTYLFPARALSRYVGGGLVSRLRRAIEDGRLDSVADLGSIEVLLDALMASDWVVYAKPCLTHTDTVVAYLGRYSHRIALSDTRLLALDDDTVQLAYTDYRDGDRHKVMALAGEELIRRFLLHVLPKGFVRIRHFGYLANPCGAELLGQIRAAIQAERDVPDADPAPAPSAPFDGYPCPQCREGHLRVLAHLALKRLDGG